MERRNVSPKNILEYDSMSDFNTKGEDSMQKNTEYISNRDAVSSAILQHLDGLRGIDTHCHHLPDDQFQNMGLKFLYDHSYCSWMDTYPDDAQTVQEFLL